VDPIADVGPGVLLSPPRPVEARHRELLTKSYSAVRRRTEDLCAPLAVEDYVLQSMPDASPVKWHLAHTSWFFETFILTAQIPEYVPFHPSYSFLFNSYYNSVGPRWPRPARGLLSRPTVDEIFRYRAHVDAGMLEFMDSLDDESLGRLAPVIELGLNHEQQHQELILTDLKHALSGNPLRPAYVEGISPDEAAPPSDWVTQPEGLVWIGHDGTGFAFDNESPRHRVFVEGFRLASRLVTNEEFLRFVNDGGYHRSELWLSDGWAARQTNCWDSPLYWERQESQWVTMTLAGVQPLRLGEPVCHVSFYEADAFARWAGARLPTEAEWESVAAGAPVAGHFLDSLRFHPSASPAANDGGPAFQLYGDVWQWTASPYTPYPGYVATEGALGEYNGKFMCNQMVLRGASCATPHSHARVSYRNFFPPDARWQFSGIRLAQNL
jgi:ergothioneine biosynthesis protein EgtB